MDSAKPGMNQSHDPNMTVAEATRHYSDVDGTPTMGDVFILDYGNNRVVEVTPSGTQTTVASGLLTPEGMAVDSAGDVFIAEAFNNRVVEVKAGVPVTVSPDPTSISNAANAILSQVGPGDPSGDPNQAFEAALAQVLQAADGNTDFVQQELAWLLLGL
jgi:hypothetical protein